MSAQISLHYRFAIALTAVLLLPPGLASAQSGGARSGDQAAADADMRSGQYENAIALYQRAITTAESGQRNAATNAAISNMLIKEGNCLLKLKRTPEAMAVYEKAAPLSPKPATAYFNLCVIHYNTGETDGALAACDRAIALNPAKADAYFVKGSILFGGANIVNGKYVVPPGTVEALDKYLELAPGGAHASDVRQMLDALK